MSDIAIRFDGVLLAASLALAAAIYLLIAFGAAIAWLMTHGIRYQSRVVARTSALFAGIYLIGLAILMARLTSTSPPVTGVNWLDWLSLPSFVLFVIGCVIIVRRARAPQ